MGASKKRDLILEVVKLYKQNYQQKDIAKKLNVTETTITKWLKEIKQKNKENNATVDKLQNRLNAMIEDKTTPTEDIKNITLSIKNLESRWFNK
jgi:transposase